MDEEGLYQLEIPGRPVPKSYSKSRGRLYRPACVKQREKEIGYKFRAKYSLLLLEGPLFFSLEAHVPDKRHGDLKNYIYLAEDALTRIAYEDDRQIKTYLFPRVEIAEEEPKTVIRLGKLSYFTERSGLEEFIPAFKWRQITET